METNEKTVLALNRFVPSKDHYRQAYQDMLKRSSVLLFVFVVLMAALFSLSVILSKAPLFSKGNLVPLCALAFALAAVALHVLLLPRIYAGNAMKRMQQAFGDPGELVTTVEADGVRMFNAANGNEVKFGFDSFVRFSETRDLLLLRTKARQTVMLSRTGFAEGCSETQFKTLMRQKCPGAKAKWR